MDQVDYYPSLDMMEHSNNYAADEIMVEGNNPINSILDSNHGGYSTVENMVQENGSFFGTMEQNAQHTANEMVVGGNNNLDNNAMSSHHGGYPADEMDVAHEDDTTPFDFIMEHNTNQTANNPMVQSHHGGYPADENVTYDDNIPFDFTGHGGYYPTGDSQAISGNQPSNGGYPAAEHMAHEDNPAMPMMDQADHALFAMLSQGGNLNSISPAMNHHNNHIAGMMDQAFMSHPIASGEMMQGVNSTANMAGHAMMAFNPLVGNKVGQSSRRAVDNRVKENGDRLACPYCPPKAKTIRDQLALKDHIQRTHGIFEEGDNFLTTTETNTLMRCNRGPLEMLLNREKQILQQLLAKASIISQDLRLIHHYHWQPQARDLHVGECNGQKMEVANEIARYRKELPKLAKEIREMEATLRIMNAGNGQSHGGGLGATGNP